MAESGELKPFQKKKILRIFHMLYDVNRDGFISEIDFKAAVDKVCTLLDWKSDENSGKMEAAQKTLMEIWEQLKERADSNKDGKVSKDEWLKMWSEKMYAIEQGQMPQWQENFMKFMFNVNDKSGDDLIDQDEYTTFNAAYGIPKDECKLAFEKISGGNQYINYGEFKELWREFFVSTSSEDKGNYLFGDPAKYPEEY